MEKRINEEDPLTIAEKIEDARSRSSGVEYVLLCDSSGINPTDRDLYERGTLDISLAKKKVGLLEEEVEKMDHVEKEIMSYDNNNNGDIVERAKNYMEGWFADLPEKEMATKEEMNKMFSVLINEIGLDVKSLEYLSRYERWIYCGEVYEDLKARDNRPDYFDT